MSRNGSPTVSEAVWSAQSTTPAAVEAALRGLLKERHDANHSFVPARVVNLVVIAEREWRGEIANRLDNIRHYHPSRTILCAVEPGRRSLDAFVAVAAPDDAVSGIALGHERVEIELGPQLLAHLDSIVDPLLVSDLTTVVWAPHGHIDGVEALAGLGQVVLFDSVEQPSVEDGLSLAVRLSRHFHVVDLAWLRSAPWRERIALSYDPPAARAELGHISGVHVRHHPDSAVSGLLLVGWLASRLGWQPGAMIRQGDTLYGRATSPRQTVKVTLQPDEDQQILGLSSITLDSASGGSLTFARGAGGLRAERTRPDGTRSSWVIMGASRGEGGILGEGIRQALLRDRTYGPSLDAARAMLA